MNKKFILTINKAEQGFSISLEGQEFNRNDGSLKGDLFKQITGMLPPLPTSPEIGLEKDINYNTSNIESNTEYRKSQSIASSDSPSPSSVVDSSIFDSNESIIDPNEWLNKNTDSWVKVREKLAELSKNDQLIIETNHSPLFKIPFSKWSLLSNKEIKPAFFKIFNGGYKNIQSTLPKGNKIRILVIKGNDEGINVDKDLKAIKQLEKKGAEIEILTYPSKQQLFNTINKEEGWHILIFVGHSNSDSDSNNGGTCGWIEINENEDEKERKISLDKISNSLKEAIKNGLQIAFFNSCDGLGLAEQLAKMNLPISIVMRKKIPNHVAIQFIKDFLPYFSNGKSLHSSVKIATDNLQGIGNEYCYLPVIFQNPTYIAKNWQQLKNNCHKKPLSFPLRLKEGLFTGREENLNQLKELIIDNQKKPQPNIIILHGMPGVGKTSLAGHFANQYQDSFPDGVITISLDDQEEKEEEKEEEKNRQIARKLLNKCGIKISEDDDEEELIKDKLSERQMLLIFDNVKQLKFKKILSFLPKCFVLITTINKNLEVGLNFLNFQVKSIPINPLSPEEAIELFKKIIQEQIGNKEEEIAERILELIGYLPLAIQIIGSLYTIKYIKQKKEKPLALECLYKDLDNEYQKIQRLNIYGSELLSIKVCFNVSFKQFDEEKQKYFSCLSICSKKGFSLKTATNMKINPDKNDYELQCYLDEFESSSLLNESSSLLNDSIQEQKYIFHPLLYAFAKAQLKEFNLLEKTQEIHAKYVIEEVNKVNNKSNLEIDIEDIITAAEYQKEKGEYNPDFINNLNDYIEESAYWEKGIELYEHFLSNAQEKKDEKNIINIGIILAKYYTKLNYLESAKGVLENTKNELKNYENKCDEIYKKTAQIKIAIRYARIYQSETNYTDALESISSINLETIKVSTENPKEQFPLLNTIASIYERCKKLQKAYEFFNYSKDISDQLDDEQKEKIIIRSCIGDILKKLGKYNEALELFEESRKINKDDPQQLIITFNSIANLYVELENYECAFEYLQESLSIAKKLNSQRSKAIIYNIMGNIYKKQGEDDKALTYYKKALKLRKNSPEAQIDLSCMANIYQKKENYEEYLNHLEDHLEALLKISKRFDNHKQQVITLNSIGKVLEQQKKYSDAFQKYAESYEIINTKLQGENQEEQKNYLCSHLISLIKGYVDNFLDSNDSLQLSKLDNWYDLLDKIIKCGSGECSGEYKKSKYVLSTNIYVLSKNIIEKLKQRGGYTIESLYFSIKAFIQLKQIKDLLQNKNGLLEEIKYIFNQIIILDNNNRENTIYNILELFNKYESTIILEFITFFMGYKKLKIDNYDNYYKEFLTQIDEILKNQTNLYSLRSVYILQISGIGNIKQFQWNEAKDKFLQSYTILEKLNNEKALTFMCNILAQIYSRIDKQMSVMYHEKCQNLNQDQQQFEITFKFVWPEAIPLLNL